MERTSIVAENLEKNYGYTQALKRVNFSIEGKGLFLIYGPNGSGKSTLLRLISGIEKPSTGLILVNGIEPWKNPSYISQVLALISEGTWLPPYYTGLELAVKFSRARFIPMESIEHYADTLGVSRYWKRLIATYSMGMRKKLLLLLGFSLSEKVSILLFDEPYTLLDVSTREVVSKIIHKLSRYKLILVATHILTKAEESAEKAIVLVNGKIRTILEKDKSPSIECSDKTKIVQELVKKKVVFTYNPREGKIIAYSWQGIVPENCERKITTSILEKLI